MPSKTSKPRATRPTPKRATPKAATASSEAELRTLAADFGRTLGARDWVLLEGPLGAGKTTFVQAVLEVRGVRRPPEGSPTFAIAHEYTDRDAGELVHLDLYRLRSEGELEEAGVPAYFWERDALVLGEWISMWPEFEARLLAEAWRGERGAYRVRIEILGENERRVSIDPLTPPSKGRR